MLWLIVISLMAIFFCYLLVILLLFRARSTKPSAREKGFSPVPSHRAVPRDVTNYTLEMSNGKPLASLIVVEGRQEGQIFNIPSHSTRIGRQLGQNEIVLDDPYVTDQHAKFAFQNGGYVLIDLMSTNGTYLNGRQITREYVNDNDEIEIGQTKMTFILVGESHS